MYQIKGFISIQALVDNRVGVTSPFGELSLWSQTFTKDRGEYENPVVPGFKLSSIYSVDSVLGNVSVDIALANRVLIFAKWIYDYFQLDPDVITPASFSNQAGINFPDEVSYFTFGEFITSGEQTLPEWIYYRNLRFPESEIKFWFSDESFSNQFEETEIVTIAPVDNLDDFFLTPSRVKTIVESRSASRTMELIQSAKNKNPETIIRTETFAFIDPMFGLVKIDTNWSVLIYGPAGDNLDSVKDAIVNYILANSTRSREEWSLILPDLFKRTEFILLPNWHQYAIPNKTVQAGMHSCVINPKLSFVYSKAIVIEYPPAHIEEEIVYFSHPYKTIGINCIAGPDNREDKSEFIKVFPDFINVGTNSLDFNRMSLKTQTWALLLERMLLAAETMTEFSSLPQGLTRVKRKGFLFVSVTYDNVQYLVGTKHNLKLLANYVSEGYVVDGMLAPFLDIQV